MSTDSNPLRPLDEDYRGFLDLLRGQMATAIANARAYEQERQRAEALAQLDLAKTTFFSNVSHEFRTPLTLMLGPLEDTLAEGGLPAVTHQRLQMVHRNGERLLKLVNTLLDFSRIEAGRMEAVYEPVDLAAYTAELTSVFRSAIEGAGLQLVVDCSPLPQPVFVDRQMWEKIVLNLLSNAFKFTFTGSISLQLRSVGDLAQLAIRDTGTGIAAQELPHLFERFHRAKGAKGRSFEGSGIGLALVAELVNLLGGQVTVDSELNGGSTFTIQLPFGQAHLPADRISSARTLHPTGLRAETYGEEALGWLPPTTANPVNERLGEPPQPINPVAAIPAAEAFPSGRILLVDDNTDMRDYVRQILEPHYQVLTAPDGQAALAVLSEQAVDLVLSDVMMPNLDGFGLLAALRSDERLRSTPLILLSARAGEEAQVEGLDAGADDYLIKPFSARELLARVAAHGRLHRLRCQAEEAIRQQNQQLERSNQSLEQFAYIASHDLQEPLRKIQSFGDILKRTYGEALGQGEGTVYLERMQTAASRMALLIKDLLSFSRISTVQGVDQPVSLTNLIQGVLETLSLSIEESRAVIQVDPLPVVSGDASQLSQLFQNLLANALKFRRSTLAGDGLAPQINLQASLVARSELPAGVQPTRVAPQYHCIQVSDNGIGFEEKYLERIFQVFQRLHGKNQYAGTGIGLAICAKVVANHGGAITARSKPGEGARFSVYLPAGMVNG